MQLQEEHHCVISGNETNLGIMKYILQTPELLKLSIYTHVRKFNKHSSSTFVTASPLVEVQVISRFWLCGFLIVLGFVCLVF